MNLNKRIIVLGPNGMLGQMVCNFFERELFQVIKITERYTHENRSAFIKSVRAAGDGLVINCIGRIKQKYSDPAALAWTNSLLPLDLIENILPTQFLIHPSTDCVFEGTKSEPYLTDDVADAHDDYGWSKRLGEVALTGKDRTLIIRVSIIGPDHSTHPLGLLGWFLNQPDASNLRGFADHQWNGITTLEWCKRVLDFFRSGFLGENQGRIIQLGTEELYTKYEMLMLFQEVFETRHRIERVVTNQKINRTLLPDVKCLPLRQQLMEMISMNAFFNP